MPVLYLLLNILWFVLGGFISALAWILAGCLMALSIIGIPWVPAAFRIAGFSAWPFGRVQVEADAFAPTGCLLNVVWFVLAGWWLAIHHVVIGLTQMLTIIGIPFGWQHFKLALLSLAPVGKRIV